jgi:hypothetical protein
VAVCWQADLCERLLEANWTPQQLPLVTIWGNCFSTYQERWALRGAQHAKRPHRILCLADRGGAAPGLGTCE